MENLSPNKNQHDRLRWMQKAAVNYRINRHFKNIEGETRFDKALKALDEVSDSVTVENVDEIVSQLAERFKSDYGKTAISAASKFLWFRCKSPVVIYDSRAFKCLKKLCDGRLDEHDYKEYRRNWKAQFAKHENSIRSSCADLVRVKDFSLAQDATDQGLEQLVNNLWFRERVFDKYLWWHGGD